MQDREYGEIASKNSAPESANYRGKRKGNHCEKYNAKREVVKEIHAVDNEGKERNIIKCYGTDCGNCSDPCEFHDCGMDVIREKKEESGGRRLSIRYNDDMESQSCIEIDENNSEVMRVLNQVAFLYIEHRSLFDALIRKIYLGQNQADISRERGISRQAVSKELRRGIINMMTKELGMKAPVAKREKLLGLTGREFVVYKKLFVDGCTERSAALQLGIPKSTIHRMGQNLRKKLSKNGARKNPVRKNS